MEQLISSGNEVVGLNEDRKDEDYTGKRGKNEGFAEQPTRETCHVIIIDLHKYLH